MMLHIKNFIGKIILLFKLVISKALYIFHHFYSAKGLQVASSLAFTSLLSLVPLLTVTFVLLSKISLFEDFSLLIQDFIFANFVPEFGQVVQQYIFLFSGKASELTISGGLMLFLVALMLLATIDNTFNQIWGIKKTRHPLKRIFIYFSLLLLGPLLIGIGIASTTYLFSLEVIANVDTVFNIKKYALSCLPFLTTFVTFILLYILVPYCYVSKRNAIFAGILCTMLFELAKHGFGVYIKEMPSYENIYGALAVIPLFFIWIYISWVIILFGAHITYCLSSTKFTSK